jgi:hypothetical protein
MRAQLLQFPTGTTNGVAKFVVAKDSVIEILGWERVYVDG